MYLQLKKEQIMVDTNEWKNQYTYLALRGAITGSGSALLKVLWDTGWEREMAN